MPLSLYAATIPSYRQTLGAVFELVRKGQTFCAEKGIAAPELMQARLAADMLPFAYQVKSTAVHSLGSIEGVRRGVFSPDTTPPPDTFATLETRVTETLSALEAIDPAEIESFIGRNMRFEKGSFRLEFSAEDFLLSFSLPNFYFHAATAYDILRWKGAPIGKRDFMGRLRLKG
ncbi:MAG: DUF1993 family protein [Steroidobacterales bacterium]